MLAALTIMFALHVPLALAGDPCGVGSASRVTADLAAAVEALPQATELAPPPLARDSVNAPFLEPLRRKDRGAVAKLADLHPDAWKLATVAEIAQAITMLQRGGTGDREERAILNLLEGLEPLVRARVLRLIDQGRDKYDLDKLVFGDVDDQDRRERLLALIEEAGRALTQVGAHEIGVISDIDDTVAPLSSDKGSDGAFPGAAELYRALEQGTDGRGQAGDIHYVTARPPLVLGDARGRLDRAGVPQGTVDDGDLGAAIFRGHDGLEDEKVRDIERQLLLHPGQRFVLVGDDSQRDPEAYRRVLQAHPGRIAGVFIHRVGGDARSERDFPGRDFVFFDDYGQAASAMAQRGLITAEQARQVQARVRPARR